MKFKIKEIKNKYKLEQVATKKFVVDQEQQFLSSSTPSQKLPSSFALKHLQVHNGSYPKRILPNKAPKNVDMMI